MQDILFKNFTGSSSGKNGRRVAKLVCSPNAVCSNIRLEDINLTSPKGNPEVVVCDGIEGGVGVPCVPASSTDGV
jgi:galacturan 1,4-alpha-galacturonidase